MAELPRHQQPDEASERLPAQIQPWLVFLLIGSVWMVLILLTVKSFVPYAERSVPEGSSRKSIDRQGIETIQERLAPVD